MNRYQADLEILEALKKEFNKEDEKVLSINKKDLVYLSVESIRARLEEVLGFHWTWETIETVYSQFVKPPAKQQLPNGKWAVPEGAQPISIPSVTITGRLTLYLPSGAIIFRDGNGGSSLDKGTGPGDPEKIAASDAFKRAAWFFGIGAYLRNNISASDNTNQVQFRSNNSNNNFSGGIAPQVPRPQIMPSIQPGPYTGALTAPYIPEQSLPVQAQGGFGIAPRIR